MITSTLQNNKLHLLNSSAKTSYITHHIKAEDITFPMIIQFYHVEESIYMFLHARRSLSSCLPQMFKINRNGKGSARWTFSLLFDFSLQGWI